MENQQNKIYYYFPVIFAIVLILGLLVGHQIGSRYNGGKINSFFKNKGDKFNDVLNIIDAYYVDTVNKNELMEGSISAMLQDLDPHSYYVPESEIRDLNDPLLGSFDGIGVEFNIQKDTIFVVNTIVGGPSEKVGIRAGDRIVNVDGKNVAGVKISNNDVMKKLKGKKNTKVRVSVLRRGSSSLIDFTITRGKIPTYSLDVAFMITKNIGFIKLSKFSATTHDEFVSAIEKLNNFGMEKLILDLRGNGGGYLDAAIKLSDEFLSNKKLIVYTEGRSRPKTDYFATKQGDFEQNDLIILIDEWSASASEIVAGAVQDNDRGLILGRRSFGKGLVQEQIELEDGSAIRLTVARYHTPSGRCIQKSYKKGTENYYLDLVNRYNNGEFVSQDSIHQTDSLKYKTILGRTVYGGGGIMPDVFIPLDKSESTKYFVALVNKGLIYQYAIDYVDKNRAALNLYKNGTIYTKDFFISNSILNDFVNYAEKNGVSKDEEQLKTSENLIRMQLKAYIGRNVFNNEGFYPTLFQNDNTVKKALDLMKSSIEIKANK